MRQYNPECSMCGVIKTEENTYKRGARGLQHICKECSSKVAKRRYLKNLPEEQKQKLLDRAEMLKNS